MADNKPIKSEIRFAVGDPVGRRSTVWKIAINGSDIYIMSRMFGHDVKVSLHASGACAFSRTGNWVRAEPGRKNADRHFERWTVARPEGNASVNIFRMQIPETELRVIDEPEDLEAVDWIPVPPKGTTISLECYLTPVYPSDPAVGANLPHPCLCSLPLVCGRWLVVLNHVAPKDGKSLAPLRAQILAEAQRCDIEVQPVYRSAALETGDDSVRGLIELAP